jgi:sugar (pentulose or hexulose) kinase
MKEPVIAVFDIGKTNKKMILFNEELKIISENEQKFAETKDDDGFECDDIDLIEIWVKDSIFRLAHSDIYDLKAVNFTTYGATLVYLDENGRRLTPVYNYLKPMDEKIAENLYIKFGGKDEFCRRTASPALGMLNSGLQALWLKTVKPGVFRKVRHILHFPQYLSYSMTGKVFSEHTSIGCHTALWDFDNMEYHPWVKMLGTDLPDPVMAGTTSEIDIDGKKVRIGIGIHDSSASLAPYFSGSNGGFLLLSTGTWCITMNPFNSEKLTAEQLGRDCLCYLSVTRQPVKSSRLFLGNLHETALSTLAARFSRPIDYYREIGYDYQLSASLKAKFSGRRIFIEEGAYSRTLKYRISLDEFGSFDEAYHQLMNELCDLTVEAAKLVIPRNDETKNIYITGGFSRNDLFINSIARDFPLKQVYVSEIGNATALGAAMVVSGSESYVDLGLTLCRR